MSRIVKTAGLMQGFGAQPASSALIMSGMPTRGLWKLRSRHEEKESSRGGDGEAEPKSAHEGAAIGQSEEGGLGAMGEA